MHASALSTCAWLPVASACGALAPLAAAATCGRVLGRAYDVINAVSDALS